MVRKRSMSLFQPSSNSTARRLEGILESDDDDDNDLQSKPRREKHLSLSKKKTKPVQLSKVDSDESDDLSDVDDKSHVLDQEEYDNDVGNDVDENKIDDEDEEIQEEENDNNECPVDSSNIKLSFAKKLKLLKIIKQQLPKSDIKHYHHRCRALDWKIIVKELGIRATDKEMRAYFLELARSAKLRVLESKLIDVEAVLRRNIILNAPKVPGFTRLLAFNHCCGEEIRKNLPKNKDFRSVLNEQFLKLNDEEKKGYCNVYKEFIEMKKNSLYEYSQQYPEIEMKIRKNAKERKPVFKTPVQLFNLDLNKNGQALPTKEVHKLWDKLPLKERVKYIKLAFSKELEVDQEEDGKPLPKKYVKIMKSYERKNLIDEKKKQKEDISKKANEPKDKSDKKTTKRKSTENADENKSPQKSSKTTMKPRASSEEPQTIKRIDNDKEIKKQKKTSKKVKNFKEHVGSNDEEPEIPSKKSALAISDTNSAMPESSSKKKSKKTAHTNEEALEPPSKKKTKKSSHPENVSETPSKKSKTSAPIPTSSDDDRAPPTITEKKTSNNVTKTTDPILETPTKKSKKTPTANVDDTETKFNNATMSPPLIAKIHALKTKKEKRTDDEESDSQNKKKIKKEAKVDRKEQVWENIKQQLNVLNQSKPPKTFRLYFIKIVCKGNRDGALTKFRKLSIARREKVRAEYKSMCQDYITRLRTYLKSLKPDQMIKVTKLLEQEQDQDSESDESGFSSSESEEENDEED